MTLNALVAVDAVLVPLQAEFLALEGIGAIANTVERIRKRLNPKLHIAGVVLTMVDRRMTFSQQVEADVRGHFGELVFGTTIPRNVRIAEAPSHGLPVLIYDNACAGAQAYILLASEFIRRRRTAAEAAQQPQASHEPVLLSRAASAAACPPCWATRKSPPPSLAPSPPRSTGAAPAPGRAAAHLADRPSAAPAGCSRAPPSRTSTRWSSRCRQFGLLQPILVRPVAGRIRTSTRSSPANGAGGRRRRRSCTKCRSWCAASTTSTPCSSA